MSKVAFMTMPDDLDARVERIRRSRAVGSALPPKSAVLRELVEQGAAVLEQPRSAALTPEAA